MDRLRAGIALFNAGRYPAAREAFEGRWLDSPADERADWHGLIRATDAARVSETGAPERAAELAECAAVSLSDCELVDAGALSAWLGRVADDPGLGTRERPPELRLDGAVVTVDDLRFPAVGTAARALAAVRDDEFIAAAVEYAETDLAAERGSSPFVTLTLDYVRGNAPVVGQRLQEHVERRRMRESDVDGLF